MRWSLRSLRNLNHRRVWIVGHRPDWVHKVHHLFVRQDESKYRNSTKNVIRACQHPDISDPFLLFNDDFFVLQPIEEVPILHNGPVGGAPRSSFGMSTYQQGRIDTRRLLQQWGYQRPLSYELHIPLEIHKEPMLEVLARAEKANIACLHKRTLYGNVAGLGGEYADDVKALRPADTFRPGDLFASTNPATWQHGRAGEDLRRLFPDPSPYEVDDPEGATMDPHDVVVVAQRTKATVRLADGRTIQRIYSKGQKVTVAEAERLNISVQPDKKKPQPKTPAKQKAAPGPGGEWVETADTTTGQVDEAAQQAAAEQETPADGSPAEEPAPPADPLTCPDCGFVAKTENGLQSHRRAKHGGD